MPSFGLICCHPVVTVGIGIYLVIGIARWVGNDGIEFLFNFTISRVVISMSEACVPQLHAHWLVNEHAQCFNAKRLPLVPATSNTEAIEAAIPVQMVDTSQLI